MLVSVLASGSKGNSTLIKTDKLNILIDAGMNLKYLKEKLAEVDTKIEDINYIFITHTHKDHIGALSSFVKKYNPKVCVGKKMFLDLDCLKEYDDVIILVDDLDLEDLHIELIKTSHDSSESLGYIFRNVKSSLVYITDTGYVNSRYFKNFKGKSTYFIESNHDIEMLTHGPYPEWLQKRVLSDVGHLSNKFTGIYLSKLIDENTQDILLLHLSEKNNSEECALETVTGALRETGFQTDRIKCAKPNEISEVYTI